MALRPGKRRSGLEFGRYSPNDDGMAGTKLRLEAPPSGSLAELAAALASKRRRRPARRVGGRSQ